MKQTNQYKLNLIESGDQFSPAPLNENAERLETALADGLKIAVGNYKGTNVYGAGNPNRLTFGFQPMLVFVSRTNTAFYGGMPWLRGTSRGLPNISPNQREVALNWEENGLSWYSDTNAMYQLNTGDVEYAYVAIGK